MLCRALLTIIAISYLICVLILSGLQKEDLDVNLLKKLQRHNVNIDEMNNEDFRQECISTSTITSNNKRAEITTEKSNEKTQNRSLKDSTKEQLQTILQYLIDSKSVDRINVALIEDPTKTVIETENYTTLRIADMKLNNFSEAVKYQTPITENIYTEPESINDMKKTDLQKFIKLWNMYNKENTKDSIYRDTVTPTFIQIERQTTQPDVRKSNDNEKVIEMEYNMNKIIRDFMTNNKLISTTVIPPFTKNDMVDRISHQIERYLAANDNNKKKNYVNDNNKADNVPLETLNLFINEKQRKSNVKILQNNNDEVLKNKTKIFLNEMLWTDKQLIEPVIRNAELIPQMSNTAQNGLNFKSSELQKNNIFTNTFNDNVEKLMVENNNIKNVKIPVEIIKEIAESIKAIVLRELKSNLSTTTPTITLTKTISEREPTTIQKQNFQNANEVMEKFMDLFQQFKTIKEKTVITGETKFKTAERKATQQDYNGPLSLGYPPPMPLINPYGVVMPMAHMTPIYTNPYDQNSNLNTRFVHDSNKNNNLNSVHKITQVNIFHHKSAQQPVPLTIQTNSYEIPPLGIPVSKPINMVNQNIVVTTRNPFMRPKMDRQHGNNMHQELVHKNKRNPSDWLSRYDESKRQRMYDDYNTDKFENSNKDNKRIRVISKERQKYTNDDSDKNQYRYGLTKSHLNKSDYERMRNRNQGIKKFHEKLERTEDSNVMEDPEECCRMKVASRQQLPLNSIKNKSRYDDTHFRNFLKTQQKVNAMLERILATKTKSDGPRSVEIP